MVYEHHQRGFDSSQLGITFARAQFGNGIIAIIAGQVAGWFADRYGKVMPFDVSILVLVVLGVILASTWTENHGDAQQSVGGGFARAWTSLLSDEKILLLGVSQAAFEGAMYTFTFVWTPALQTAKGQVGEIPHGTIFSSFMAATMIGSNLFAFWQRSVRVELLMRNVFGVAAVMFILTTLSGSIEVVYGGFLIFEVLCGIYFPGMATMRAPYIPEESRSAILNFFRVPLNLIVVIALYEDLEVKTVFALCACLMIIAVISQQRLMRLARYAPCDDQDIEGADVSKKAKEYAEEQT
ncbi:Molybdate-anion transporter [Gracilaria domingensis]|nr:Molybdate-anion transporter [Gracilaria domingensis]